jgi:hypothetical protein
MRGTPNGEIKPKKILRTSSGNGHVYINSMNHHFDAQIKVCTNEDTGVQNNMQHNNI